MKCDVCGRESEFGLIKERKSFRTSHRTVCPTCLVRRRRAFEGWNQVAIVAFGILGYTLLWFDPTSILGHQLTTFFLVDVFLVLCIIPHELGHAITAHLLGWRVFAVVIGIGRQIFKFHLFGILFSFHWLPVGGITQVSPTNAHQFRLKRFLIFLAGPSVNAAIAVAIFLIWRQDWHDIGFGGLPRAARICLWANLWVTAFNLWPHQSKTLNLPTDGKQLLKTFSTKKKDVEDLQAARYALEAMMCRDEHNELKRAIDWCNQGLALFPSNLLLLNVNGILLLDQADYTAARQVFLRLLSEQSKPSLARYTMLNNIAYVDALIGDQALLPEADAFSKEAYNAASWMPSIVGTRGNVLVAMGQVEEGIRLLKESFEKATSPRNKAENACHLAMAHVQIGMLDEAAKYLKLARQLDSHCPFIQRAETALRSKTPQSA